MILSLAHLLLKVCQEIGQQDRIERGMMKLNCERHEEIILNLVAMAEIEHGSGGLKSRFVKDQTGKLESWEVPDDVIDAPMELIRKGI